MIKCAAYKLADGRVLAGHRHGTIIKATEDRSVFKDSVAGFIDSDGNFYDRVESARIAYEAGQIPMEVDLLVSEDLY
jgi:hypothetical protein